MRDVTITIKIPHEVYHGLTPGQARMLNSRFVAGVSRQIADGSESGHVAVDGVQHLADWEFGK